MLWSATALVDSPSWRGMREPNVPIGARHLKQPLTHVVVVAAPPQPEHHTTICPTFDWRTWVWVSPIPDISPRGAR